MRPARPAPPPPASRRAERFEPWAWPAFGLLAATLGLLVLMGWRPGGELAVLTYLWGPLALGGVSAGALLLALVWCLRRRPVLQRGRAWPLAALAVALWLCSLPIAYPSSHEGKPSPVRFRLPFDGPARVVFGGERRETNRLLFDPSRRFGTCFQGTEGGPLQVVAPADGRLVGLESVRGAIRLVLEVAPDEFLALEGLELGPDAPEPGARIRAGEALGRAPTQLFAFLMDGPQPGRFEGVPLRYWGYLADGRAVEVGVPIPPQLVTHVSGAEEAAPGGPAGH